MIRHRTYTVFVTVQFEDDDDNPRLMPSVQEIAADLYEHLIPRQGQGAYQILDVSHTYSAAAEAGEPFAPAAEHDPGSSEGLESGIENTPHE